MMENKKPIVVAITGASGSVYGIRCVEVLAGLGESIALTMSHAAGLVIREELGIELGSIEEEGFLAKLFTPSAVKQISYYPERNLAAPISSGSYPIKGMIVIPASTASFSKIANGISETLVERAAECAIKEGRRLVIVPRETPLSAIHLENLLKLARLGARIVPAMPAFYSGCEGVSEMVDFVVGKALDQLDIPHALYRRWVGGREKS